MKLLLNSTPIALWQDVVHEAESACSVSLQEEIESYLVFLLVRYTNKPEVAKKVIATQFLQGMGHHTHSNKRHLVLQDVGDQCLLFSGLFPKIAEKRLIKVSYFINIGQSAYSTLSKTSNDLYGLLAAQFVLLMDILQSIRYYALPDLLPIEAYDLWNESGSQRA